MWILLLRPPLMFASLSPAKFILCVAGLCALVSAPRPALCFAGLCALVSAPPAGLCVAGLVWTCFGSLRLPSATQGLCACFFSLPALFVAGGYLFFFQLCYEGCLRCPSLYASPLSPPESCSLL